MSRLINNDSSTPCATTGLALRIVQAGEGERTVSLPDGKCTVGSSERCQVPLLGETVRPLHCLITSDAGATQITRWADGALLNGQEFTTAPFQLGDCLQIGEVQLCLIEADRQSDSSPEQQLPEVAPPFQPATESVEELVDELVASENLPAPESTETSQESVTSSVETKDKIIRLQAASFNARQRCRNLVRSLRKARTEVGGLDEKVVQLQQQLSDALAEREQSAEQLVSLQEEVRCQESQAAAEIDRLIDELSAAYEKATTAETSLAQQTEQEEKTKSELRSLYAQREQWEQVREVGEQQLIELSQAAAEREEAIKVLQAEIETLKETASQAEVGLDERTAALDALQFELDSVLNERDRLTADLQESNQELQGHGETIKALQTELETLRESTHRAEAGLEEKNTALSALEHELESVQNGRDQLAADLSKSKQELHEAEKSLAESEQNFAQFQAELERFQQSSQQTEQRLTESNSALEELQTELAKLNEEREQWVVKRTEYQLREQGSEHEIAERDGQIAELKREIEECQASIEAAKQEVSDQASETIGLQHQLEELTTERDQLLETRREQAEKFQEIEQTLATRNQRIQELQEEHEGICQLLQSVEEGAFEQVDACNKLESQLSTLRAERDELAESLPRQQEYISQLEETLAERDGQITLLSEELTQTTVQQTDLETELGELKERYGELSAQQSTSEACQAETTQQLAFYEEQTRSLQEDLESTQQERERLGKELTENTQLREHLQRELERLVEGHEQLTADYQHETTRRQELESELASGQKHAELFQVDLQSVQAELKCSAEHVTNLLAERETLQQQLIGLREELSVQENSQGNAQEELLQQRDELSGELEAVRQELQQLRDHSDTLEQELNAAQERAATAEQVSATQPTDEVDAGTPPDTSEEAAETNEESAETNEESTNWPTTPNWDFLQNVTEEGADQPAVPTAFNMQPEQAPEHAAEAPEAQADCEEQTDDSQSLLTQEEDAEHLEETSGGDVEPEKSDLTEHENAAVEDAEDSSVSEPVNLEEEGAAELEVPVESQPAQPATTAFDKPDAEGEEPVEEYKPISFIDQYQHILDGEGEAGLPQEQVVDPAPVKNRLGAELDAMQGNLDDESDDAALEDYMANMLRRMRGESNDETSQAPVPASTATLNQNPDPLVAVDNVLDRVSTTREADALEEQEPLDMEELKQSSRKPKLPTDMSAMRELANSSARRAIAKHHKQRHKEKALGLLFVCLVSIGVGSFLVYTAIASQQLYSANSLGGFAAIGVGLFGGIKLIKVLFSAVRAGSRDRVSTTKTAS